MGLAFLQMGDEEKTLLGLWIQELSGDTGKGVKRDAALPDPGSEGPERTVLQQLITLLMRKGFLTQAETESFRRDMDRKPRNK